MRVSAQDGGAGLAVIDVATAVNIVLPVTTSPSPWTRGTTSPVTVTATKQNQALAAQVAYVVTDRAGNPASCY